MDNLMVARFAMAALMPFAVYRLRRRALARAVSTCRELSAIERRMLRQSARASLLALVAFWTLGLGLMTTLAMSGAPPGVEWAGAIPVTAMGATWVSVQLRVVCPACQYPLGYQKPVGVPARCERCGARL
jgi:hypothetical protein